MTPEQQAAFVVAQAACVMAEIAGMQATNATCDNQHHVYKQEDFEALIVEYGIHQNAVIGLFQ